MTVIKNKQKLNESKSLSLKKQLNTHFKKEREFKERLNDIKEDN